MIECKVRIEITVLKIKLKLKSMKVVFKISGFGSGICWLVLCGLILGVGMLSEFCVTLQRVSCSIVVRVLLKIQQCLS
jgi:hypothetical protein